MSYILEALRKSDQQRQLGAIPTLDTGPAMPPPARTGRGRALLIALLVPGLVLSGFAIGWLGTWKSRPPPPLPKPAQASAQPSTGAEAPHGEQRRDDESDAPHGDSGTALPRENFRPARLVSEATPEHGKEGGGVLGPVPAADPPPREAGRAPSPDEARPAPPAVRAEATAPSESRPISRDVPEDMSGLAIAFLAYSSIPAERRVMLDGEILRQGDVLPSGIKLEEIRPDGVVLDYKGRLFLRSVR